jgi:hypothetical protein
MLARPRQAGSLGLLLANKMLAAIMARADDDDLLTDVLSLVRSGVIPDTC